MDAIAPCFRTAPEAAALYNWQPDIAANAGSISPPELSPEFAGTHWLLRWPADHLGWTLLQQTNHLDNGLSLNPTDWGRLAPTTDNNQYVLDPTPDCPAGFYRLVYP